MRGVALDTNAYSALDKGDAELAQLVYEANAIGIPITVLGEIYHGIYNGTKESRNISRLEKFLKVKRTQVLTIDRTTAQIFGEISTHLQKVGKPMQQNDVWIAALCKQHDFALITRDKGFENILGLQVMGS